MIALEQVQALIPDLQKLTRDQFDWIERLIKSMSLPVNSTRNPNSDVFTDDRSLELFFLYLVTHHSLSSEPFKKEKFEYAIEKMMGTLNRAAARPASRTHRGHDLTVSGERWSFKSEAHKAIKKELL
jgi:hypothetical protein